MKKLENSQEISKEDLRALKIEALRSLGRGEITGLINIPLYAIVLVVLKLHMTHFAVGVGFAIAFVVLSLLDSFLCYLVIHKKTISLKFKLLLYPVALSLGLCWSALFLYVIQLYCFGWQAMFVMLILVANVMVSIVTFESDLVFNNIYAIFVAAVPLFMTSFIENSTGHEWTFIALAICFAVVVPVIINRNYKKYWENGIKAQLLDKKNKKLIDIQKQLSDSARKAGMAEVASSILHNVGNLMNSVNVATQLIHEDCHHLADDKMDRVIDLFKEEKNDLGKFFIENEKARDVITYMEELQKVRKQKNQSITEHIDTLLKHIEQIKKVIDFQQINLSDSKMFNKINIDTLIDNTVKLYDDEIRKNKIKISYEYQEKLPVVFTDKTKLTQILINLLSNAIDALRVKVVDKEIIIRAETSDKYLVVEFIDNGIGILPENLVRVFNFGFTMKSYGHGFGLHSSSLFARELGGDLTAQSEGENKGAKFTLRINY